MISADQLAEVFVDVADTLVADFDLLSFLHTLVDHAATVSGAEAVGLLLADHHDHLRFMAATSERGKLLDLYQLQTSQGPCLDSFRTQEPVVNADLATATDRWPLFAPHAIEAGFQSVHAFPMRLRDTVIGGFNLFGSTTIRFEPAKIRIVQALADVATIAILQERSIARAESFTEQLQGALNSRIVIEQAKGAVAKLVGIDVDDAFEIIRARARANQLRLVDVAHAVLA
jgi:GAF domain-containing protein